MLSRWILFIEIGILLLVLGTCAISTAGTANRKNGEAPTTGDDSPSDSLLSEAQSSRAVIPIKPVYWPTNGWRRSTPEEQGMDSQQLVWMFEYIESRKVNLHSLLIIRNGYLVTEAYFDPYTPETPHEIASLTKSVIGTLIGIAIDQGYIQSVDQPVLDFFPGREIVDRDSSKTNITIEHLLTMTPGLNCNDAAGTEQEMRLSTDWVQFILDLPLSSEPGDHWSYCSGAVHLLSAILQNATGIDARSFANANLFNPLGIAEVPPERWYSDPKGISTGSTGLQLAPRDLAKYAYLYQVGGRWEQTQIVPTEWVKTSTQGHIAVGRDKNFGDMDRSYGYLWSIYPEQGFYSALGMGGQQVHIVPEQNLVVIYTAATPVNTFLFELLQDYIIPSVKSTHPLPAKPPSMARLEADIREASSPEQPVPALPAIALQVSGKTFRLEDNPMGWQTLTVFFEPDSLEARIQFNKEETLAIGLDNLYSLSDPPGFPGLAMKGRWETEEIFSIKAILIGTFFEYEIRLTFQDEQLILFMRDTVSGGLSMRTVGVHEK